MDAVGAADAGGVLELEGAALQDGEEFLHILAQDGVGLLDQVTVGRIHHVGGGQAVVDPFALGAERFADGAGECHDVVAGAFFNLLDAGDVELRGGADLRDVFRGDDAQLAPGFAGEDFDFEVGAELVFFGPDIPHDFAGVTFDHRRSRVLRIFFSMRAARSASSAFSKGSPVICS